MLHIGDRLRSLIVLLSRVVGWDPPSPCVCVFASVFFYAGILDKQRRGVGGQRAGSFHRLWQRWGWVGAGGLHD